MGCDIHLFTEALITIDGKPTWFNVDNWKLDHYGESKSGYVIRPLYKHRNYSLFTALAGVRDYSDSGNEIVAKPRGLPDDVSPIVRAESDEWGIDGHTHSWLTLLELKRFSEAHPATKKAGLITPEQSAKLNAGVLPDSWCQGTNRRPVVRREWEMPNTGLTELIQSLDERCRDEFWIFGDDPTPDETAAKIRIVFWFDN